MNTWEDTVMNKAEIAQSVAELILPTIVPIIKARCEAQAEITYHSRDSEVAEARKAGREDVVKWIEEQRQYECDYCGSAFEISNEKWFSQLKEWGIKE